MHTIRHYSFDLWLTLIKSDGEYKKARAKHIWKWCYIRQASTDSWEDVAQIIRDVEKWGDAINQMNGKSISPLELLAMVVFRVQGHLKNISMLDMEVLYKELEDLFFKHPPVIYSEETIPVLDELTSRGKTLSLLSNTGFIRGKTLDKLLDQLGIKDKFMFRIYSDEVNLSKPNRDIFRKVDDELAYNVEDIMHVGDNILADGIGAQEYGFAHMIINSNHLTIKDLL
jgi:putative hydrolase of the HAD superfamily